jgi:hypothetical protein
MRRLQRPIDQRKWGQSSWVNYWLGRDDDLWTADYHDLEPVPVLAVTSNEAHKPPAHEPELVRA